MDPRILPQNAIETFICGEGETIHDPLRIDTLDCLGCCADEMRAKGFPEFADEVTAAVQFDQTHFVYYTEAQQGT